MVGYTYLILVDLFAIVLMLFAGIIIVIQKNKSKFQKINIMQLSVTIVRVLEPKKSRETIQSKRNQETPKSIYTTFVYSVQQDKCAIPGQL